MLIVWDLSVKFRAFGITFGTVKQNGSNPMPLPPPPTPIDKVLFNDRGVYLHVVIQ